MSKAVLDNKIKYWEDQLLDLSKRNKMISFRESKRATLKILKPGFDDLYQQIVVDEKELTFQKAIDRDSDVRLYSILSLLDQLSYPMEVNIGDIRAEGSLPEIKKTLKHLRSKSRLSIDEQGTNILYLVFGFVEWREKGTHNDNWVKSPLILVPVTLSLPSLNAQYSIKKHEDEIVVNPTLAYLFERDYNISLPEFDSDTDSLDSYMQKMEELVNDRGWRIVRECSMGLVSFLKISMYNDLIRNEDQLKANPIIRAFAGEQNEINNIDGEAYVFDHDACRSVDSYQVLDADSSQQDAIALSQKGISFVMQGPPGTGKSQTITNIIAQALADGKKVLFVSEKMAALDVVYRRLTDVHLADFCLSLHSHKANKKEILDQLGANLNLRGKKVKNEEIEKLARLDMLREQLKSYVHDIHQTIMPLEMSLYEVYGAISELDSLPDIDILLANVDNLTKDDVNRLALLVANMDKAQGLLGSQWYKNPWQGITNSYLEVSQKRDLQYKLQDAIRILSDVEEAKLTDKTLADVLSIETLDNFSELYEHAQHCSNVPHEWFNRPTEQEEQLIRILRSQKQAIDNHTQMLAAKYGHEYFELGGQDLREKLVAAMRIYCTALRSKEPENESFDLAETDLQSILLLRENYHLLLDALKVFSDEYKLPLSYDYTAIETVLTICDFLLKKKKLSSWYFSEDNREPLLHYISDLRGTFSVYIDERKQLCSRYSEAILDLQNAIQLQEMSASAEESLSKLSSLLQLGYHEVCSIASFDLEQLCIVKDAVNHSSFAAMANAFKLSTPTTLAEVQTQISAINKVKFNKAVPAWQTYSARNRAKLLLQEVASRADKLSADKSALDAFFKKHGIVININTLSEDDVQKILRIDEIIPDAETIVQFCNNNAANNLLDLIDSNVQQHASLEEKINALRTEYHISTSLDNTALLSALQHCRNAVFTSAPYSAWASSKSDARALLDQISTLANNLKQQREKFLEVYEDSVFSLDYVSMLNRFKVEYTSFLKIFKSSYKEDIKQVRLIFRDVRKKISDEEVISLLQELRKYHSDLDQYLHLAPQVAKLLDIHEYNIGYDWDSVKSRLNSFDVVSHLFQHDLAAYQFIVEERWNSIYVPLAEYDALSNWFNSNSEAKSYYASLYLGFNTDTSKIRALFAGARSTCPLFTSPNHYTSYLQSGADAQQTTSAKQHAVDIVTARNWFAEKAAEIAEYSGYKYSEEFEGWREILANLEVFESIVAATGESTGYSLVDKYITDSALIDEYLEVLVQITKISECAKFAKHISYDTQDFIAIRIDKLIDDIQAIVSSANTLKSIYTTLSFYCPEQYTILSVNEIKKDLNTISHYQNTRGRLPLIEQDAQRKLGEEYHGIDTNWDSIYSNIASCSNVIQLLNGHISAELKAAFADGAVLYAESQVAELRQYYTSVQETEATHSVFSKYQDLISKTEFLDKLISCLNEVINIRHTISSCAYSKYCYSDIVEDLKVLTNIQKTQKEYSDSLKQASSVLPTFSLNCNSDWTYMTEIFDHLRQVKRTISTESFDTEIVRLITNEIPGITVISYAEQFKKLMQYKTLITEIIEMFENKSVLEAYSLTKLVRRFRNCDDQFATMDSWIDFRDCRKACIDNGLEDFIITAEDTYYPSGTLKDVFLKSFYYEWFEKVCAKIDSVATFRVRTQESRVKDFCELDAHQLPVDQMRIREKLIREMPGRHSFGRATDEVSTLLHELEKKRKIMPLRKLFRTIPNLLLRLKPCLMMSPLSVSYFLEAETYRFDMVIFDEASQIFPQDAIGAIFRAKQVIIAGDSKQLPPTNFFAVSTSNDTDYDSEDDEDEEEVNFDSVLEEASNSLPNRSLLWHYRSRFEELISFSNRQIYQNNLITFPSNTIQTPDTGVEYVHVKNGIYENRCNRIEAKAIVRVVAEHIKKYPDRSLGIIAFSESQQSIIEDEINKFRTQNPMHERFFSEDKDEPFFVKNLENVQGDERDTIIFSICYAKNAQGRMYMRFGPLGQQGGERRLNVAITRAKHNIKLVGSILPEDIDLSKTRSEGVRMLRLYIAYAMHGAVALPKSEKKSALYDVDVFSEQVGKFLTSRGCKIRTNVGSSDYTIDIAVEHPKKPGQFIAGIECDGSNYYMAKTVRDREHLRTAVLERMGWRMYRVWSTEWIRNPEQEKDRLITFIQEALLRYGERTEDDHHLPSAEEIVSTELVIPDSNNRPRDTSNPYNLPLYKEGKWKADSLYRGKDHTAKIVDMIRTIVMTEQPIHLELLYKRTCQYLDAGRVTQYVRQTIDQTISERMNGEIIAEDHFIHLVGMDSVPLRRSRLGDPDRTIEQISIPEIAGVMERILVGAYGIDRNELCSEAARVFGFERSGAKIKQRTSEAVDYLIESHKVSDYDNKIQLMED